MIYSIDPGNTHTALIVMEGLEIRHRFYEENHEIRRLLRTVIKSAGDHMAIEMVASYGMAVGATVFDTCVAIGRFIECWGGHPSEWSTVFRMEVKMSLCHNSRAKDGNIRQALIDLYGGIQATKKGGPLHGISGDLWAALAVGVTFQNRPKA